MTEKWTHLRGFDVDQAVPKAIRDKGGKLQKRVEKMNADRAKLDADIEAFRSETDATMLAAAGFEKSRELRIRTVELLQAEVKLRKDLGELRAEYQKSLVEIGNAACEAEQKLRAEVLAGMIELGFPGPNDDANSAQRIEGYCNSNLRIRAAVGRKDEIATWGTDTDYSRANDAATKAVEGELQRIRQQLTTI